MINPALSPARIFSVVNRADLLRNTAESRLINGLCLSCRGSKRAPVDLIQRVSWESLGVFVIIKVCTRGVFIGQEVLW